MSTLWRVGNLRYKPLFIGVAPDAYPLLRRVTIVVRDGVFGRRQNKQFILSQVELDAGKSS